MASLKHKSIATYPCLSPYIHLNPSHIAHHHHMLVEYHVHEIFYMMDPMRCQLEKNLSSGDKYALFVPFLLEHFTSLALSSGAKY